MKYAIGPRRELGVRTIFNILGPLTNPASATHQIIGVFDASLTEALASVLGRLGTRAAYVVHGADGLEVVQFRREAQHGRADGCSSEDAHEVREEAEQRHHEADICRSYQ